MRYLTENYFLRLKHRIMTARIHAAALRFQQNPIDPTSR